MANHSDTFKVEYLDYTKLSDDVKVAYLHKNDKLTEDTRDIKIVQNEVTEDTRGSILASSQSINHVAECGDNKKDFNDTKKIVLYNNFEEWRLQHHCHSN